MQQRALLPPERRALGAPASGAGPFVVVVAAIAGGSGGVLRPPHLPLGLLLEAQHHVGQAHLVAAGGRLTNNHPRRSSLCAGGLAVCCWAPSLIATKFVAPRWFCGCSLVGLLPAGLYIRGCGGRGEPAMVGTVVVGPASERIRPGWLEWVEQHGRIYVWRSS